MEYFGELKKIARIVERGVEETRKSAEKIGRAPDDDDDTASQSALLLLRNKKTELQQIRSQASELLRTVRSNASFTEIVSCAERLMKKNFDILEKTETHLKQYGYMPSEPETPPQNSAAYDTHNTSESTVSSEDHETELQCTPPKQTLSRPSNLDRTPKMCDFGITDSTLKMLSDFRASKLVQSNGTKTEDSTFKVPKVPTSEYRGRSGAWSGDLAIPAAFQHEGFLVTPGLMPGINKHRTPHDQCLSAQYHTSPAIGRETATSPKADMDYAMQRLQLHSDSSEDAMSPGASSQALDCQNADDSPIPPVFVTPGVKQFKQYPQQNKLRAPELDIMQDDTPEPPVFETINFNQFSKGQHTVEKNEECPASVDDTSPVPPMFQTPGVKQIGMTTKDVDNMTPPYASSFGNNDLSDTPEPPELTMNYGFQLRPSTSSLASSSLPRDSAQISDSSTFLSSDKLPGQQDPEASFLSQRPVLRSFEDMCDTPEAPELTFSYKGLLSAQILEQPKLNEALQSRTHEQPKYCTSTYDQNGTFPETSVPSQESPGLLPAKSTGLHTGNTESTGLHNTESSFLSREAKLPCFDDVCDTPEPPELTFSYKELISCQIPVATKLDNPVPHSTPEQLVAQSTVSNHSSHYSTSELSSVGASKKEHEPVIPLQRPDSQDFCATPETPNLTFSYEEPLLKQLPAPPNVSEPLTSLPQEKNHSTLSSQSTHPDRKDPVPSRSRPAAQTRIPHFSSQPLQKEFSTPQMPELTGTYNFTSSFQESSKNTLKTGVSQDKENYCPNVIDNRGPASLKQSLFSGPPKPSFPEEVAMCVYIPTLSEEDYNNQPDYMRRVVELARINNSVQKLNQLVAKRLLESQGDVLVSDADLRDDLEPSQVTVLFLCLMRLGRVTLKTHSGGKKYYALA